MTKVKFETCNIKYFKCEKCGEILPKENVQYRVARDDGSLIECCACSYMKRHENLELLKNWNNVEYKIVLNCIFNKNIILMNEITDILKNKSLQEVIDFITYLNIHGKKLLIQSRCSNCDKEILIHACKHKNNNYCCKKCYWEHKAKITPHGKDNPQYNRVKTTCTNCNKDIDVIPYEYNLKNEYGDNHNFCCKECYWEYRKKYYVGKKSPCLNRNITPELLDKMRKNIIKLGRSSKRFDSKIQLVINDILDNLNIKYDREYVMKYYAMDNYLIDFKLIIEVMGDYWHVNPLKYNKNKYLLNGYQAKWLPRDKSKHTYVKSHYNIEILYLWEDDIENNLETCKNLITEYIKRNGILKNYHSFNYCINNNELQLNNEITKPYQDMPASDYHDLIKNKKVG